MLLALMASILLNARSTLSVILSIYALESNSSLWASLSIMLRILKMVLLAITMHELEPHSKFNKLPVFLVFFRPYLSNYE